MCFAYAATQANLHAYEKFRKRALNHSDILFVVIADECHWGITLGGAHDCFINDCYDNDKRKLKFSGELLKQPNVLSLLVSATPFNVLASPTYIKPENVTEWFTPGERAGKYVRLEDYMQTIHLEVTLPWHQMFDSRSTHALLFSHHCGLLCIAGIRATLPSETPRRPAF